MARPAPAKRQARRAGRAARGAVRGAFGSLVALDAARPRHRRGGATAGAAAGAGMLVAISHWRSKDGAHPAGASTPASGHFERPRILHECVRSLLELDVQPLVVVVITNEPALTARDLREDFAAGSNQPSVSAVADVASARLGGNEDRRIVVAGWRRSPTSWHGYHLPWAHKRLFRAGLSDDRFSHFLYLEDDLRFTAEAFSYRSRFREPLALHGLLPGFVRYETRDGERFVVDQQRRQGVEESGRGHVVLREAGSGEVLFVSLENPYQGMYLLDRELLVEHLTGSPARSRVLSRGIRWPNGEHRMSALVRERAAMGPILDAVPSGFRSRTVVPVHGGSGQYVLDDACLIEHLAARFTRENTAFGSIRVDKLFADGVRPQLTGSSPRL